MRLIIHKILDLCKRRTRHTRDALQGRVLALGAGREQGLHEITRGCIVISVGILGFGLGALSTHTGTQTSYALDKSHRVPYFANQVKHIAGSPATDVQESAHGKQIVVSKKGKKYHYVWCKGAQSINPSNRRYFSTIEEARAAGYTAASNCLNLK